MFYTARHLAQWVEKYKSKQKKQKKIFMYMDNLVTQQSFM